MQDAEPIFDVPPPEHLELAAERAFQRLAEARYVLVEMNAGMGEAMMRFTIQDPKDRPDIYRSDRGNECRVATVCINSTTLFYNPQFVNTLDSDEILFGLASMGDKIRQGYDRLGTWNDGRDPRVVALAMSLISHARIKNLGIGRIPDDVIYNSSVTPTTSIDDAYIYAQKIADRIRETIIIPGIEP